MNIRSEDSKLKFQTSDVILILPDLLFQYFMTMKQSSVSGTIKYLNYENLEEIPDDVLNDSTISVLYLKRNLLKTLSREIFHMASLVEIYLDSNLITSLPTEFCLLSNLERLDLQQNKLDQIPTSVCQLPKLKKLNLFGNAITCINKDISNLKKLIDLNLAFNKIVEIPLNLCECSALEHLNLGNNNLCSIPKQIIRLHKLEALALNNNHLVILPLAISSMKCLKFSDTRKNSIHTHDARALLSDFQFCIDMLIYSPLFSNEVLKKVCDNFFFWYRLSLIHSPLFEESFGPTLPVTLKELAARVVFEHTQTSSSHNDGEERLPRPLREIVDCPVAICLLCERWIFCSAFFFTLDNLEDFPVLRKALELNGELLLLGRSMAVFCSTSCCKTLKERFIQCRRNFET